MKPYINIYCSSKRRATVATNKSNSGLTCKRFVLLTTVLVLLFVTSTLSAQEKPLSRAIMMSPQYVLNNALRFEFDFKLDNTNTWLIIDPQFYQKHKNTDDALNHREYDQMIDASADILMRNYLLRNKSGKSF